ncbi:hypothetical protein FNV43_RR21862 [Rhamnella rubrinervis]|uniref:Uncharacterized protein n=1 Tax=Rhamnella rubrinervis TaxID=2594499 RepID=A0A8K0DU09_9ROSA|nr:hypothetical protein FNV43_RR21862 [Rhamnella rubrinervis]
MPRHRLNLAVGCPLVIYRITLGLICGGNLGSHVYNEAPSWYLAHLAGVFVYDKGHPTAGEYPVYNRAPSNLADALAHLADGYPVYNKRTPFGQLGRCIGNLTEEYHVYNKRHPSANVAMPDRLSRYNKRHRPTRRRFGLGIPYMTETPANFDLAHIWSMGIPYIIREYPSANLVDASAHLAKEYPVYNKRTPLGQFGRCLSIFDRGCIRGFLNLTAPLFMAAASVTVVALVDLSLAFLNLFNGAIVVGDGEEDGES